MECLTPQSKPRTSELTDIASSLDYNVVGHITQHREAVDAAYCIGAGKLDEIGKTLQGESIDVVIFTRQLSAGQFFRIGKRLGNKVRVLDRNLLILEIFEKRSVTPEAKLQIELARLRYTFSWGRESIRMQGIISEQMGRGGPGQYPYEAYEAMSRKRISKIEGQLRQIRSKQSHLREHRRKVGFQIVALTGYTQSGKTTLFNRLASESKEMGLGPFTTLSAFARRVRTAPKGGAGHSLIMIDSIGFIEDLNPLLLNAFHTTLSELANSDLILLFVDGSDEIKIVKRKVLASREVMQKEVTGVPIMICVNKIDLATREHIDDVVKEIREIYGGEEVVEMSAKTGANVPSLMLRVAERLASTHPRT